jgi:putative tryptophan/tyrosine transport system substrate-binding protein
VKRRDFITLLGSAAAAWPLTARAQQPATPVIGFLSSGSAGSFASRLRTFRQGLGETGYVEGRNVAIEFRWAEGRYDRMAALAADLVHLNVAVIFASNGLDVLVAKAASATIPIVFNSAGDPVALGLVASLSRPGSNITGVSNLNQEVGQKRLELLHALVPTATRIAFLQNPTNLNVERMSKDIQEAANILKLQLHVLDATTDGDFGTAFAEIARLQAGALLISTDPFFTSRSNELAALTVLHGVPAMSQNREFPAAGGLISYGGDITDSYRLAGGYVGRILKGEKPADLPVQQSTKIELIINLKAAKALGITVPITLLGRADEVIE